jgi:hypothetical protein
MAKKKAKKSPAEKSPAKKSPAKKSLKLRKKPLKLRKKPLRDLPAKKTSTKVKGGSTLTPSQLAALQSQPTAAPQPTFAAPYVPVEPGLQTPRPR